MKRRLIRMRTRVLVTGGVALFTAAPVWADCCSGIFSCAATIVTYGVSCEVETILDTIRTLVTVVENLASQVSGQTQTAENSARQSVTDTLSLMQTQSQQSSSDLATALSQATALYKTETQLLDRLPPSVTTSANPNATTLSTGAPASAATPAPAAGSPLQALTAQHQSLDGSKLSSNPQLTQSTVNAGTQITAAAVTLSAPHGAYGDAFSRAVAQITALKGTSDHDFSTVNQYLTQAQNSEGPGIAQADTIGGLMNSPLTVIKSQLASMLANPINAFDPTSVVDGVEATVTANLSANIGQMITDITTGPDAAFNAAQPTYDDLLANAQSAQAITAAMSQLYKMRTPGAADALYALLPSVGTQVTKVTAMKLSQNDLAATRFGQRVPYSVIAAKISTTKQQAQLAYKPPQAAQVNQIHSLVAQFKTQRAQGKSGLPQAQLVGYKSTLTQQFNGYFNGKTPAGVASERDQLVAQARTNFSMDPATASAVIGLINTEATSRGAVTSATSAKLTNPVIPGQPTTATGTAASVTARQTFGVVPAATTVTQPATATTAVKTPTWGAAPAWTPAGTATVTQPATTTLRTAQPVTALPMQSQSQQSTTLQAAPSSLGR